MDRNALDWLFSTAPQAIAALVGLIVASASFILGKVDDRIEADSTLADIGQAVKDQIYKDLESLLWWTLSVVVLDLAGLFFNPIEKDRIITFSGEFSPYFTIAIIVLLVNAYVLYMAIEFVQKMMNPQFFDNTIKDLLEEYKPKKEEGVDSNKAVKIGIFLEHFIAFEKLLRRSEIFAQRNYPRQKPLSISQMILELKNREYLTKDDYKSLKAINRLRNMIMHEGKIEMIEKEFDDKLVILTKKLQEILPKRD